ncbi:protein of unknown function [Paenibacillus alvei]|uniref:Uncharacterized protein n=1 Tax=Paenibacillus alvei TaxID=44250 RepID=A0A383RLG2_PAEAL|nr:protein of unknown function [Paenibacillus alvei]
MQPLGTVLKELIPELTSVSEVERYTCEGCGNQVVVIEAPIIGGRTKENSQGRSVVVYAGKLNRLG